MAPHQGAVDCKAKMTNTTHTQMYAPAVQGWSGLCRRWRGTVRTLCALWSAPCCPVDNKRTHTFIYGSVSVGSECARCGQHVAALWTTNVHTHVHIWQCECGQRASVLWSAPCCPANNKRTHTHVHIWQCECGQ
jgi:hypothetical protein